MSTPNDVIEQATAVIHRALCSMCGHTGTGLTIRGRDADQAARALAAAGLLRIEPAPATTPNLIGQEIGSLPDEVVNAIVRDPNDPRYPAAITVYCDRCHVERQSSYIVHDKLARAERLAIARAHMRTLGWVCDTAGDFCPGCRPADTTQEPRP